MTPDKRVEEIVKEFRNKIYGTEDALFDRAGNNVSRQVEEWLRNTLTQHHQDLMSEVVEKLEEMKQIEQHEPHCDGYCNESACYLPDILTRNRTLTEAIICTRSSTIKSK